MITKLLKEKNKSVHIETSGAYDLVWRLGTGDVYLLEEERIVGLQEYLLMSLK